MVRTRARRSRAPYNTSRISRMPSRPVDFTVKPMRLANPVMREFCGSASPTISRVPRERQ